MSTWVAVFCLLALHCQTIKSEFGEKLNATSSEAFYSSEGSSEEYYDDSLEETTTTTRAPRRVTSRTTTTTSNNGVVIEKAILAAEVTPKASYHLNGSPRMAKVSMKMYATANGGGEESVGYSESSESNKFENPHHNPSANVEITTAAGKVPFIISVKDSSNENIQDYGRNPENLSTLWWNQIESNHKLLNSPHQKPYSSTYRNSNDIEITTSKVEDLQGNGLGLSDRNHHDSFSKRDYSHDQYQKSVQNPWNHYPTFASPDLIAKMKEASLRYEQDRLYQIEAAKMYLQQVQAAQEYAMKAHALQNALLSSLQPSHPKPAGWFGTAVGGSYLQPAPVGRQPSQPTVFPRTEAPGVGIVVSQNGLQDFSSSTTQSPLSHTSEANPLEEHGWQTSFSHHGSVPETNLYSGSILGHPLAGNHAETNFYSQPTPTFPNSGSLHQPNFYFKPTAEANRHFEANSYSGPIATPVILPNGFLADTDEVNKARIAHLQALMNAIEAASVLKNTKHHHWS